MYIIIREPLTLKISVSLPHVYLLKGMLEKVVLETENSGDDVFGLGEEIEVAHFVWMTTGTHHIVHVQGVQPTPL